MKWKVFNISFLFFFLFLEVSEGLPHGLTSSDRGVVSGVQELMIWRNGLEKKLVSRKYQRIYGFSSQ